MDWMTGIQNAIDYILEGGKLMNYRIEEKPEMILTGYKKHFTGAPYCKTIGIKNIADEDCIAIDCRLGMKNRKKKTV